MLSTWLHAAPEPTNWPENRGCICRAAALVCKASTLDSFSVQILGFQSTKRRTWSSWKIPMQTPIRSSRVGFQ
jgi:hypothetical protein